eukprot:TRINITY_DN70664_c0_g1_i1.p1 TRINITY_DN70664_c0_g1~~TRINITY_DN70664_c0_g1_i1.p1  ORF type:complete len:563 (+),score=83.26 TRINITY_DN70664_c0_g1_i1:191-1879(+)
MVQGDQGQRQPGRSSGLSPHRSKSARSPWQAAQSWAQANGVNSHGVINNPHFQHPTDIPAVDPAAVAAAQASARAAALRRNAEGNTPRPVLQTQAPVRAQVRPHIQPQVDHATVLSQVVEVHRNMQTATPPALPIPVVHFKDLPKELKKRLLRCQDDLEEAKKCLSKARRDEMKLAENEKTKTFDPVAKKLLARDWQATRQELREVQRIDIKGEFEKLCKKRAEEMQAFIVRASKHAVDVFEPAVQREKFVVVALEALKKFKTDFTHAFTEQQMTGFETCVKEWAPGVFTKTMLKVELNDRKEFEKAEKFKQKQIALEAAFQSQATEELLLAATLDAQKIAKGPDAGIKYETEDQPVFKTEKISGSADAKIQVSSTTSCGELLRRQPELQKRLNIGLTDKPFKKYGKPPTPRGRSLSSQRSQRSSQRSQRSSHKSRSSQGVLVLRGVHREAQEGVLLRTRPLDPDVRVHRDPDVRVYRRTGSHMPRRMSVQHREHVTLRPERRHLDPASSSGIHGSRIFAKAPRGDESHEGPAVVREFAAAKDQGLELPQKPSQTSTCRCSQ